MKQLRNVFEETEYLFRTLSVLDRNWGRSFFSFPRVFAPTGLRLKIFFALIPGDRACAFEFRSPSWLDDEILDLLRKKGCSLCIADADENPVHEIISTASWGYLRLRRSDYTDADLSQWAGKNPFAEMGEGLRFL